MASLNHRFLRWFFPLILLTLLGAGIYFVVCRFNWLDEHHVAGVAIIGLLFSALAVFGMTLQIGEDIGNRSTAGQVSRAYGRYILQIGLFLILFLGWLAGLVIVTWKYLTPLVGSAGAGLVFLPVFLFGIYLIIKVLTRLADRGIIGPPRP